MNNTYIAYIATSKDGFIADDQGTVDFLNDINQDISAYEKFYETIDILIYGSKTYETIKSFGLEEWPYKGKRQYVLTSKDRTSDDKDIIFTKSALESIDHEFGNKRIWVMGGANVIQQYIKEDMISEFILFSTKENIGSGTPLFKNNDLLNSFNKISEFDLGDLIEKRYVKHF